MPLRTRLAQGVGIIPSSLKEYAFNTFVLLFYSQVLGLPAIEVSAALFVAMVVDAVSDPLVGSYSDHLRTRWGRRHPLMLGAVLPFGGAIYCLFAPPVGLEGQALFLWLLAFTIATRLAITFFTVPWNALFAELTDDYQERTVLVSYRFAIGWVVGIAFISIIFSTIFVATPDHPQGQLNAANYPTFAFWLSLTTMTCAALSTLLTLDQLPYLRQPGKGVAQGLPWLTDIKLAMRNRDLLILLLAVLANAVVAGTNQAMQMYMNTYFWGFDGEDLRWMSLALIGGLFAFVVVGPLQARYDKKYILVGASFGFMFIPMIPVTARLLAVAPPNGSEGLLAMMVGIAIVLSTLGTLALIMYASMVADVLDEQELATGQRQEGLFNSVITFSGKATTGVGIIIAGWLLDYVIRIPVQVEATALAPDAVWRLGVVDGYVVPLFALISIWLMLQYSMTREKHSATRAALAAQRSATPS